MQTILQIIAILAVSVIVSVAEDQAPSLAGADRTEVFFLGTDDLSTKAKPTKDQTIIRELERLLSGGTWESKLNPPDGSFESGEFRVFFYKKNELVAAFSVGRNFLIRGDISPGGIRQVQVIGRERAKTIRSILGKFWFGPAFKE